MAELSAQTLVMEVQAVDAEISRIKDSVAGDISELEPDSQELLLSYSLAATELKTAYLDARRSAPGLPPYERLVGGT
jgi:hypothetical protein